MLHFCCSRSLAPSWFTSQAATILPTRAIRAFCWNIPARRSRTPRSCNTAPSTPTSCRFSWFITFCSRRCCGCSCECQTRRSAPRCCFMRLCTSSAGPSRPGRNNVWFFNPLAWQLLIVFGAWWVIEGKRFWPWVTSRTALVLAVLYLVFSLIIALSCSIKPLEALVPQTLTKLLYPLDKSNLDPLRLLHFFALAILVVWLVPRDWRGLTTPVMRCAIRCGENSLPIYCLGVLLVLASHIALVDISDGLAMQIALSLGGILVLIAAATLLNLIRTKPRAAAEIALMAAIPENGHETRRMPRSSKLPSATSCMSVSRGTCAELTRCPT